MYIIQKKNCLKRENDFIKGHGMIKRNFFFLRLVIYNEAYPFTQFPLFYLNKAKPYQSYDFFLSNRLLYIILSAEPSIEESKFYIYTRLLYIFPFIYRPAYSFHVYLYNI